MSGVLDGHRSRGLPLDNFNLNKFTGTYDSNYRIVKREIMKMVKKATGPQASTVP
jgi:hypothetical protein